MTNIGEKSNSKHIMIVLRKSRDRNFLDYFSNDNNEDSLKVNANFIRLMIY